MTQDKRVARKRPLAAACTSLVAVGIAVAAVSLIGASGTPPASVVSTVATTPASTQVTTPSSGGTPAGRSAPAPSFPPAQVHFAPPSGGRPLSAHGAVSLVMSDKAEVRAVVKLAVTSTTLGKYRAAVTHPGEAIMVGLPDNEPILVVAVSGTITPELAGGESFPWATFVYDANTAAPLGERAGPSGTWPPFFASVVE